MTRRYVSPEHARWARVMEYLIGLSVEYNRDVPMPWRLKPPLEEDEPDYAARLRELEQMVVAEVEQAILELIEHGESQIVSDAAKIWLGIRVDTCIQFVSLLATNDGFITCPCLPIKQVARWVLIDWWRQHGAEYVTAFDPERFP